MNTRALLVDTGFSALPIYKGLVDGGFEVWTIGNREDDPLVLLNKDRWIRADYNNTGTLHDTAEKLGATFVIPGCTDVSLNAFTAASLPATVRKDSVEAIDVLNTKTKFRAMCSDLGLNAPRRVASNELNWIKRVIAKPADSFSGRGITIFNGDDESAAKQAAVVARAQSPTGEILFEEYIEGHLYSHSSFLEDRKVVRDFVVREGSRYNEFAVDLSYVTDWAEQDPRRQTLRRSVEAIANELELTDGLFHLQFILRDDVPFLIEATRRCPGDLYARLIELSTGFPYAATYGGYFTGSLPEFHGPSPRKVLRHTYKTPQVSNFTAIEFRSQLPLIECYPVLRLGTAVDPTTHFRAAVLFMEAKSQEDLLEAFEHHLHA